MWLYECYDMATATPTPIWLPPSPHGGCRHHYTRPNDCWHIWLCRRMLVRPAEPDCWHTCMYVRYMEVWPHPLHQRLIFQQFPAACSRTQPGEENQARPLQTRAAVLFDTRRRRRRRRCSLSAASRYVKWCGQREGIERHSGLRPQREDDGDQALNVSHARSSLQHLYAGRTCIHQDGHACQQTKP